MELSVTVLISVITALLGAFFGYKSHARAQRSDSLKEGKQDGVMLTELQYIKSGIDAINYDKKSRAKPTWNSTAACRRWRPRSSRPTTGSTGWTTP